MTTTELTLSEVFQAWLESCPIDYCITNETDYDVSVTFFSDEPAE